MKRRKFIKTSIAAGALVSTSMLFSCQKSSKKMTVLVLGGTNFVGPAIVKEAMQNGHEVTLFNRGISNPNLFPDLRLIKGDRTRGPEAYEPLLAEKWDVIIDVWPERAVLVEEAVNRLKNQTEHYIFISSIAVYNNFQEVGLNEASDVVNLDLSRAQWSYSEEKLAAEKVVQSNFPDQHTIIRCGAIKGWRDPALDLLYWCIKLNRDESIIAPGSGNDPIQFVDVNDVGRFAIWASENNLQGIYNCVGPVEAPLLWKDFLAAAKSHFNSKTALIWASEDFLAKHKVASFSDLPLWAPLSEDRGFMQISHKKLDQTGFEFTPLSATLADCMKWHRLQHKDKELKFGTKDIDLGLARPRELDLIEKLKES